jgi:hypothetical protein
MQINKADVAELVDARDLKSLDGNVVWVRLPPPAPGFCWQESKSPRHPTYLGFTIEHTRRVSRPKPKTA